VADVVVTLKVMPASPDVDLAKLEDDIKKVVADLGGEVGKVERHPIAFGLNALHIFFVRDESKGGTDDIEEKVAAFENVNSVEAIDVRRALG